MSALACAIADRPELQVAHACAACRPGLPDEPYDYAGHTWSTCVWTALQADDVTVATYLADMLPGRAGVAGWPTGYAAWAAFFAQRIVAARAEAAERRNPRR